MRKVLGILCLISFFGCKNGPVKNQNVGNALGTTYSILYITDGQVDLQKEIDSVFQVVNQSMSTYIPDSDISKINKGDSTLVVDHMFQEVFELSKRIHDVSNGYFDPTVGVLVNAWGFGPEKAMELDSTRVDSLLQYVGFNKVGLTDSNTIRKERKEIYFDFNAVAKGYTIDRLGALLESKGIENYLVELGGEVLTQGTNMISKKEWTVGIDDPQAENERKLKRIIRLKDRAMASSGNYRKFRVDSETGEKYVHTINPKTGFTKNSKVLATSVIANTCAEADALATAFMAMDLDDTKKLLLISNILGGPEVYVVYLDSEGKTKEYMTPGFENLVVN
ncbi:FAD:protein FMN transferase [Flagellimonas meridianipacifica]|uniref:FAD:protein FMN transferase n=1 Tax=Flagellimonas meridianipacifica TaxID=1080225 RepID=A0A2T0MKE2_9FLAO|nr:FAD:protein FMN transferase [Allomuricauda pacifica]PRX57966.1 thiamine biosynthesis lipoprotein [Allomuricauda pacifica]